MKVRGNYKIVNRGRELDVFLDPITRSEQRSQRILESLRHLRREEIVEPQTLGPLDLLEVVELEDHAGAGTTGTCPNDGKESVKDAEEDTSALNRETALGALASLLLGVMGYQAQTVAPPKTIPSAVAMLPSNASLSCATEVRRSVNSFCFSRFSSAHACPACTAPQFRSTAEALPSN